MFTVHVTVSVSPLFSVASALRFVSNAIVPADEALNRPALWTAVCVADAVNVLVIVYDVVPLVWAYVPWARDRPPDAISPVRVVSPRGQQDEQEKEDHHGSESLHERVSSVVASAPDGQQGVG